MVCRSVPPKKELKTGWTPWHSSKHAWLGMAISAKSQWLGHWFDRESKFREETRESASKTAPPSHLFSRFDSHFCVSLQLGMWHVDALNRSFLKVSSSNPWISWLNRTPCTGCLTDCYVGSSVCAGSPWDHMWMKFLEGYNNLSCKQSAFVVLQR